MANQRKGARTRLLALGIALAAAGPALVRAPVQAQTASAQGIVLTQLAGGDRARLADFRIVNVVLQHYEQLNEYVVAVKAVDNKSSKSHIVTLGRGLRPVDTAAMDAAEIDAYNARYGKLDTGLFTRLATASPTELVPVNIWFKQEPSAPVGRPVPHTDPSREELDSFFASNQRTREAASARQIGPVKARIEALGYAVVDDGLSTLLQATMTPADIRTVGTWEETDRIFAELPGSEELDAARATIKADAAPASSFTGAGVTTAMVEYENARVAIDNPFLDPVVQDPDAFCSQKNPHATLVAGIISSSHPTNKGIAPGATNFATGPCGGNDAQLWTAIKSTSLDAVEDESARVVNLSWGIDTVNKLSDKDKWYDDLVFKLYPTVVKAAGNLAGGTNAGCTSNSGNTTSPGLGYNMITVGASDDKGTASLTLPTKDNMYVCSSFKNPVSFTKDRQKPDVVAPGTAIRSTGISAGTNPPWLATNSGTSFAAPMVTGAAAVLMDVDSSLESWPESIRAILQATAWFGPDGSSIGVSDRDGAGLVQLDRAVTTAQGSARGDWGGDYFTCSADDETEFTSMTLTANKRTRVAIAWPTDTAYASYYSKPSADLDLYIYRNGVAVAHSTTYDNSFELVDFVPNATGTYKLFISAGRCDLAPGSVGWAWHKDA